MPLLRLLLRHAFSLPRCRHAIAMMMRALLIFRLRCLMPPLMMPLLIFIFDDDILPCYMLPPRRRYVMLRYIMMLPCHAICRAYATLSPSPSRRCRCRRAYAAAIEVFRHCCADIMLLLC